MSSLFFLRTYRSSQDRQCGSDYNTTVVNARKSLFLTLKAHAPVATLSSSCYNADLVDELPSKVTHKIIEDVVDARKRNGTKKR